MRRQEAARTAPGNANAAEDEIYRKLARHLDDLPGGYPPAEDGVELRILRRLFAPEQARLALLLTLIPEPPAVVARRAGISTETAARMLSEMAAAGLIVVEGAPGKDARYGAAQFVVGIWEFQVNRLDPELIRDVSAYMPTLFNPSEWRRSPQMRIVPVNRSLTPSITALPYERAEALVSGHVQFGVRPCICRRERTMMGEGCGKPEDICLTFGMAAAGDAARGVGRLIAKDEALDLLRQADAAGLALHPGNSRKPLWICCCCGCCCGILRQIRRQARPAEIVSSPFSAVLNPALCKACGICVERCQMDAIAGDKTAARRAPILNPDRCIGCGLCVTRCPTGALSLVRRPADRIPRVPRTIEGAYYDLARRRGRLSPAGLLKMVARSGMDRFRSR